MVDIKKQNNVIKINVTSSTEDGKITPANDASAYYSSLSKAWANKTNDPVDGTEYSSKYYAGKAKESAEISVAAKNEILNNAGFQAVSADLAGDNNIGVCAENISSILGAASNAQIASNKAAEAVEQANIATEKAQEVSDVLAGAANTNLSNITDSAKEVIKANSAGMAIGTIFPCFATADYTPLNALPCDGTEYTSSQFPGLWEDYLTAETPKLLTCTYDEYEQEFNTNGMCPKFAVDSINNKFKVPILKNTLYQGLNSTAPVRGNGKALGLNTTAGLLYPATANASNLGGYFQQTTSSEIGSTTSCTTRNLYAFGISTNPATSGILTELDNAAKTVAVRWFVVVVNSSQDEVSFDWAQWASNLAAKANTDLSNCTKPYITETYQNGTSWYRVYSDGWCEQGGVIGLTSGSWASVSKTFLKQYKDTNYLVACIGNWSNAESSSCTVTAKSMSGFTVTYAINTTAQLGWWQACGYIN